MTDDEEEAAAGDQRKPVAFERHGNLSALQEAAHFLNAAAAVGREELLDGGQQVDLFVVDSDPHPEIEPAFPARLQVGVPLGVGNSLELALHIVVDPPTVAGQFGKHGRLHGGPVVRRVGSQAPIAQGLGEGQGKGFFDGDEAEFAETLDGLGFSGPVAGAPHDPVVMGGNHGLFRRGERHLRHSIIERQPHDRHGRTGVCCDGAGQPAGYEQAGHGRRASLLRGVRRRGQGKGLPGKAPGQGIAERERVLEIHGGPRFGPFAGGRFVGAGSQRATESFADIDEQGWRQRQDEVGRPRGNKAGLVRSVLPEGPRQGDGPRGLPAQGAAFGAQPMAATGIDHCLGQGEAVTAAQQASARHARAVHHELHDQPAVFGRHVLDLGVAQELFGLIGGMLPGVLETDAHVAGQMA